MFDEAAKSAQAGKLAEAAKCSVGFVWAVAHVEEQARAIQQPGVAWAQPLLPLAAPDRAAVHAAGKAPLARVGKLQDLPQNTVRALPQANQWLALHPRRVIAVEAVNRAPASVHHWLPWLVLLPPSRNQYLGLACWSGSLMSRVPLQEQHIEHHYHPPLPRRTRATGTCF